MRLIVLCGKSGSGKDTVAKELIRLGYKRVVTYTTRPPRDGEIDGVDYHFVTDGKFMLMKSNGDFLETTEYHVVNNKTWFYGTPFYELDNNKVVILNPDGVKELKKYSLLNPVVFYLFSEDNIRYERLKNRGDDPLEMHRRMYTDENDFKNIGNYADYHIPTNMVEPKQVAEFIKYKYKERTNNYDER